MYVLVGINGTIKQFVVKLSQIVKESVQFFNRLAWFGEAYA